MEAKEQSFKSIMQEEHKFVIPFFQRAYVWKKENWEKFFEDLKNSFDSKKEHFLGSVILKRSQGNENFSNVIDGQQRLTTFSILIKSLYDKLEESKKQHFNSCLFEDYTDDLSPKINHSHLDKEKFMLVMQGKTDAQIQEGILGCYNFFTEQIQKYYGNNREHIFEFIKYINDSKIWVAVTLNADEDEQKIFDSINSTGEPLSATDIIKNALFDKVVQCFREEKSIRYYDEYWRDIFEKDDEVSKFWNEQIPTGRMKRTRSEILLHACAIIEGLFNPDKHTLETLSSLYKQHFATINNDELIGLLQSIAKYAEIYLKLPRLDSNMIYFYEEWEKRFFHITEVVGISVTIPLVLYLKEKIKDEKILQECFYMLEILILCNENTKDYNKFFASLIIYMKNNQEINIPKYLKEKIRDEYMKHKGMDFVKWWLEHITNQDAKLILFWIELYRQYKQKDYKDKVGLQYHFTLEHLMPESWQESWSEIGINDDIARQLIYQIGNMTLVKGALNTSLRNKSWKEKLSGDGKARNFLKKNADLLITRELFDYDTWDKEKIEKRTEELLNDFLQIWRIDIFFFEK